MSFLNSNSTNAAQMEFETAVWGYSSISNDAPMGLRSPLRSFVFLKFFCRKKNKNKNKNKQEVKESLNMVRSNALGTTAKWRTYKWVNMSLFTLSLSFCIEFPFLFLLSIWQEQSNVVWFKIHFPADIKLPKMQSFLLLLYLLLILSLERRFRFPLSYLMLLFCFFSPFDSCLDSRFPVTTSIHR